MIRQAEEAMTGARSSCDPKVQFAIKTFAPGSAYFRTERIGGIWESKVSQASCRR